MNMIAARLESLQQMPITLHSKLAAYCSWFGLGFRNSETNGQALRVRLFDSILKESLQLLDRNNREFIEKHGLVVTDELRTEEIDTGRFVENSKRRVVSATTLMGQANSPIILYRSTIFRMRPGLTKQEYVLWVRDLLLHEIGHARDCRTDKEMADDFGY